MPKRSLALVLSLAVAIATGMAVLLYPSDAYAANCPGPSLYCGIYGEITAACYYVARYRRARPTSTSAPMGTGASRGSEGPKTHGGRSGAQKGVWVICEQGGRGDASGVSAA
jgi:hypothetical protein